MAPLPLAAMRVPSRNRPPAALSENSGPICLDWSARVTRLLFPAPLAIILLGLPAAAHAAGSARLVVTRDTDAAECPGERALRDAVGARLGYEPFGQDADMEIAVAFRREGATLRATVQVRDRAGTVKGERVLSSSGSDCEELASATSLTISILLDPRSGMIPPRPPDPMLVPDPPPAAPTASAKPPIPPRPAQERVRLRLGAAATGSSGNAPAPAAGLLVGVGVEHRWWSASVELRVDLPASATVNHLDVRTSLLAGDLVPCAHFGMRFGQWYGCGVLALGAVQGEIVGASPSRQSTFHAMLGPRLGLSIPLVRWLSLDGHVDAAYALTRTTLRASGSDVWATSAASGLVGIGLVGRFP
jgi:hypothetical protein